ncbi:hypothetical protein MTR_0007s0310 [Medicago truncatula]|uniref:Inositol polyphosphate-related phosphatase domain-containing protein n=1 Tax=Medicago truncatula TaxID=3880 RepID=A0A072TJ26_MEDTR|nr:hypothetical protein MTR_0007s0310 [Medicago truncatula]
MNKTLNLIVTRSPLTSSKFQSTNLIPQSFNHMRSFGKLHQDPFFHKGSFDFLDELEKSSSLRIIWLGDLNYRINLSNVEAKALISKKQWSKLLEKDKVPQKLLLGNRTLQYHNFGHFRHGCRARAKSAW